MIKSLFAALLVLSVFSSASFAEDCAQDLATLKSTPSLKFAVGYLGTKRWASTDGKAYSRISVGSGVVITGWGWDKNGNKVSDAKQVGLCKEDDGTFFLYWTQIPFHGGKVGVQFNGGTMVIDGIQYRPSRGVPANIKAAFPDAT